MGGRVCSVCVGCVILDSTELRPEGGRKEAGKEGRGGVKRMLSLGRWESDVT